jgi:glycosyltransferase involved in cell wall biosynthesis
VAPPRIDFVVPVKDGMPFIGKTLEALRAQTLPNTITVVDAGSTDTTIEECIRMSITWVHGDRRSRRANWNRALREGSSEYVCVMCADDLPAPRFAERVIAGLERSCSAAFAACRINVIDESGKAAPDLPWIRLFNNWPSGEIDLGRYVRSTLTQRPGCHFVPSAVILRRSVTEELFPLFPTPFRIMFDWAAWTRLVSAGHTLLQVDEKLLDYRWHRGSGSPQVRGTARWRAEELELTLWLSELTQDSMLADRAREEAACRLCDLARFCGPRMLRAAETLVKAGRCFTPELVEYMRRARTDQSRLPGGHSLQGLARVRSLLSDLLRRPSDASVGVGGGSANMTIGLRASRKGV